MAPFSFEGIVAPLLFFCLGVLAFIYRSLVEDDVEPLLLNLTLFAGIGVIVTLVERGLNGPSVDLELILLTMFSLLCVFGQIFVYRHQIGITERYLYSVLQTRVLDPHNEAEISNWVYAGLQIMKVDFFPELYKSVFQFFGDENYGPRYKRKFQFIQLLPPDKFNKADLTATTIEVPPQRRERWWRLYFLLFLFSWLLYFLAAFAE